MDGFKRWKLIGSYSMIWSMGANSFRAYLTGIQTLDLSETGQQIKMIFPTMFFGGIMTGNYHGYWDEFMYLWSRKAKAFVMVEFAKDKGSTFTERKLPFDYVKGACY